MTGIGVGNWVTAFPVTVVCRFTCVICGKVQETVTDARAGYRLPVPALPYGWSFFHGYGLLKPQDAEPMFCPDHDAAAVLGYLESHMTQRRQVPTLA